ncbi:MAG: hypothetical protein HY664_05335 [Chloroflexi bacterium]|nr:hypothetical protein [Chloroflexota bacterium]
MAKVGDALWQEMETFAIGLAREAGQILLSHFGKSLDVEYKGNDRGHPVSTADKEVEEYLKRAIKKRFAGHSVLGEESLNGEPHEAEFLWVVDPLDGTVNFINGLPIFAVSIGLLHQFRPVVGAIFVPSAIQSAGGVFHARRGGGSFVDGERISVVQNHQPEPSRLGVLSGGLWRRRRFLSKGRPLGQFRVLGSIAYELVLVARGVLQYAVFASPRIWDVAAGALLVQEAGGVVLVGRRNKPWHPLDFFEPLSPKQGREPPRLQHWSVPTLAANQQLAWWMVNNMGKRRVLPGASLWKRLRGS